MVGMVMIKCPEGTRGNIRDMGQQQQKPLPELPKKTVVHVCASFFM